MFAWYSIFLSRGSLVYAWITAHCWSFPIFHHQLILEQTMSQSVSAAYTLGGGSIKLNSFLRWPPEALQNVNTHVKSHLSSFVSEKSRSALIVSSSRSWRVVIAPVLEVGRAEEDAGVMDLLLRLLGALEEDSIDTHKWYAKQYLIQLSKSRQDNRGRRAYLGIRQESSLVYLIYGRAWKQSEAHRFII